MVQRKKVVSSKSGLARRSSSKSSGSRNGDSYYPKPAETPSSDGESDM
jgi:hypothetical protein